MRLTHHADYALRLLMYAALKNGALVQIQEVADAYGISKNHLMKVAFHLGKLGFLETVRGRSGGLRLARPPQDITVGDVVRKTEEFRPGGMLRSRIQWLRNRRALPAARRAAQGP